jgi:hypothetical protein
MFSYLTMKIFFSSSFEISPSHLLLILQLVYLVNRFPPPLSFASFVVLQLSCNFIQRAFHVLPISMFLFHSTGAVIHSGNSLIMILSSSSSFFSSFLNNNKIGLLGFGLNSFFLLFIGASTYQSICVFCRLFDFH